MYFSRVTVAPQFLSRKELLNLFAGNNYTEHQLLWRLFDDDKRQYLFRRELGAEQPFAAVGQNNALPVYYLVSKYSPVPCKGLEVVSKPYQPKLLAGSTFGFTLRANPIVAKKVEGKKNSVHHDVLMNAKQAAKAQQLPANESVAFIDEAGKNWLLGRSSNLGFEINDAELICDGYQQHRFYKGKKSNPISISTVDYSGLLTITDPAIFEQTLFNGIGRANA
ncbi:MAG: type I-E CRISPR-associated protein Cas6/Cse3/CasE, partial [Psychrosphaera sp.]|nr:type I-E CRISPR-associated protein Cas6/Cse3/CasE [Psychrosphaera sp.]